MNETRICWRCNKEIPEARVKALPDTSICVECSEETGGEFGIVGVAENMAKEKSLKKNYGTVKITKVRRNIRPKDD